MDLLTRALVDDAAIFPPGLSPVPDAVAQHLAWRRSRLGERLGPLLLSPDAIASLPGVLDELGDRGPGAGEVLPVGIAARPGTSLDEVDEAVATLRELGDAVRLETIELAAQPGWQAAARHGVDVALELPRDPADQVEHLDALEARHADTRHVVAKWRTQASPAGPIPTPDELAAFITACVGRSLPFKLTGGLHHAVARTAPAQSGEGTEEMHGALNVAHATHLALCGAPASEIAAALAERDERTVAAAVSGLEEGEARALRAVWVSFGCCGVTDPLGEAAELGLLDPTDLALHTAPDSEESR